MASTESVAGVPETVTVYETALPEHWGSDRPPFAR